MTLHNFQYFIALKYFFYNFSNPAIEYNNAYNPETNVQMKAGVMWIIHSRGTNDLQQKNKNPLSSVQRKGTQNKTSQKRNYDQELK